MISINAVKSALLPILTSEKSFSVKCQAVCDLLAQELPYYHWVGFYWTKPNEEVLQLGEYHGASTEHVLIPFGRGICGQAAQTKESTIVGDVTQETNYLSCSILTRSEIVIPILRDGVVLGEIDIDSHDSAAFTIQDQELLEWLGEEIALQHP